MQPIFNFDGPAAISVLALLGTGALIAAALLGALVFWRRDRRGAAGRSLAAAAGVGLLYLAVVAGIGAASRPKVVAPGQEKYFCELDCHIAYSVVGVRRVPELAGQRANGVWQVVQLRVRFDPETTSPGRGDRALMPNPRRLWLMDGEGRRHNAADVGLGALSRAAGPAQRLSTALRPGESFETTLVFDVPAELGPARLVFTEASPVTRVLIGHENSLLHARTTFDLQPVREHASR